MNGYPRRYRERHVISHGKGGEEESSQSRKTRIPTDKTTVGQFCQEMLYSYLGEEGYCWVEKHWNRI